jgi:hypothetical protein
MAPSGRAEFYFFNKPSRAPKSAQIQNSDNVVVEHVFPFGSETVESGPEGIYGRGFISPSGDAADKGREKVNAGPLLPGS